MEEPDQRGRILVEAATNTGLVCRTIGGVGIRLLCPTSTALDSLHRELNDLDLVTVRNDADRLAQMLEGHGVMPERRFNLLHGEKRLLFHDPETGKHLDVFIDVFEMCHKFNFKDRLEIDQYTISLADMLATKLQIVEINEKDIKDILSMFIDHDLGDADTPELINGEYLAKLCGDDWGVYKTFSINMDRLLSTVDNYGLEEDQKRLVVERVSKLKQMIEGAPKSLKWKMRAKVGERVQWYELPEADKEVVDSRIALGGGQGTST